MSLPQDRIRNELAEIDANFQELEADAATLRHYLTEVIDYLEALGDALTLMPPEMRDPRDLADEIREMLS